MDVKSIAKKNGLSESLVTEVLQKFPQGTLQFLLNLLAHKQLNEVGGDVIGGDVTEGNDVTPPEPVPVDNTILDVIIQKYLPLIINQYLPNLWKQYGPQIIQFVQNNLVTILNTFGPQIAQMIAQLFLNNLKKKQ